MRLLLVAAFLGFAVAAQAAEKTFTWTAPTTNTDGSPLAAAQIAGYTITCGTRVLDATGPVTSFKADFAPGSYTCSAVTRHVNGNVSAPSNQASFTVPQPTPNAPGTFSVN